MRARDTKIENRRLQGHSELLIWNIPNKTKRTFKSKCVEQGKTMREVVLKLIEGYCNNA